MVLDTLDGFFARLTQLVVRVRRASSIRWPTSCRSASRRRSSRSRGDCGRSNASGGRPGFIYVTAAAMRLARFNIQTTHRSTDKRYFVGMPSPAAAAVIASTVYLYPYGLQERGPALPALAMVLVPAFLMVSTIRFRSVKAIDVGWRRSYLALFLAAVALALIASHPRLALVVISYTYVAFACVMWGVSKLGKRHGGEAARVEEPQERYLE